MRRTILVLVTLSLTLLPLNSCKPTVLDLNKLADKIEAGLKDKPYGYQFVISKVDQASVSRAWGSARRSPDSPQMNMSVDVKYTTASVSKSPTAAALLKLLDNTDLKNKGLTIDQKLDEKISDYLPYNWKPGANVNTITFRELLKHRSGIRCSPDADDYKSLRKCLDQGINVEDKQKVCDNTTALAANQNGCYRNINFGLMRVLMAVILGAIKKPVLSTFTEDQTDTENAIPAKNVYLKYVNDNVFAPAGLPTIFCKPTDGTQQGLTYKHAAPTSAGGDFGDFEFICGAHGWFLSASQLAKYFQTLNTTNKILPPALSTQMRTELFGYDWCSDISSPDGPVTGCWKTGGHPAAWNAGEINTALVHFSNGVEVAIVINSDFEPAGFSYVNLIAKSHEDLLNGL
jgi:CubicO group peptidase (beta-lactamase class C family)